MFQNIESQPLTLWYESKMNYTFSAFDKSVTKERRSWKRRGIVLNTEHKGWKEWAKMEHLGKEWSIQGPKTLKWVECIINMSILQNLQASSPPLSLSPHLHLLCSNILFKWDQRVLHKNRDHLSCTTTADTRFILPRGFIQSILTIGLSSLVEIQLKTSIN